MIQFIYKLRITRKLFDEVRYYPEESFGQIQNHREFMME